MLFSYPIIQEAVSAAGTKARLLGKPIEEVKARCAAQLLCETVCVQLTVPGRDYFHKKILGGPVGKVLTEVFRPARVANPQYIFSASVRTDGGITAGELEAELAPLVGRKFITEALVESLQAELVTYKLLVGDYWDGDRYALPQCSWRERHNKIGWL